MAEKVVPVILAGGSGTRLWPLSRQGYPKQFLNLVGSHSMLQQTWQRVSQLDGVCAPLVVTNEDYRFMVAEQLRQIDCQPQSIVLEPMGRNTAPAICLAALAARGQGDDPLLLILPSDHVIGDAPTFLQAVQAAIPSAEEGYLVTFGIVPTAAETGYGYIKLGPGDGVREVSQFVEKPDADTARAYVDSGQYVWNSGMFLMRASKYLDELKQHQPALLDACEKAYAKARRDVDFLRVDKDIFATSPDISIDYGVMEKTDAARVLALDAGWNDVGSWAALWQVAERDADGNVHHGDVMALDCKNSYAWSSDRLIAMIGLEDIVVVDSDDALLVAHKHQVQKVRDVVARLKREKRSEATVHRKVYRPWGAYDSIDADKRFQVKRITVKPGGKLSLQMHHHRAEHWVVVSGTAKVTRGDETFLLVENESTYIPIGTTHRMENPGKVPLELIEVQSGSYLGEDDIVRFEDVYGREDQNG